MRIYDFLSREPINLGVGQWYYETKKGIYIVAWIEPTKVKKAKHIEISWKKLKKSLERYKKLKENSEGEK